MGPLHNAAYDGRVSEITRLIKTGADPNATRKLRLAKRAPPLCRKDVSIVLLGHLRSLDQLLLNLFYQCCKEQTRLVRGYADRDADACRQTPLMYAAQGGHSEACKELLSRGAKLHVVDDDGLSSWFSHLSIHVLRSIDSRSAAALTSR